MTNPILKEIHDIRKQILTEHDDDLGAYLRSELKKTKASGHPVAKIKQRTYEGLDRAVIGGKDFQGRETFRQDGL
jgi:hypothetical protein